MCSRRPLLCLAVLAATLLGLGGGAARADDDDDNAPPALDAPAPAATGSPAMPMGLPGGPFPGGGPAAPPAPPPVEDGPTPADTATAQVTVQSGNAQATLHVLNPHNSGAPLWLWLEGRGGPTAEARILDPDGRVLWRGGLEPVPEQGELVVVVRPASLMSNTVTLQVSDGATPPRSRDVNLGHPRVTQLSLPIVVVGGARADAYAEKLRARAPDRIIHTISASALPKLPAAYLGVSAVLLGTDAVLDEPTGTALRLFSCARGGVATLAPVSLPPHGSCPEPPLLTGGAGAPSADALLQGLREFQVQLGLLEERGPPGFFGGAFTDAQAASALLLSRPPARMGVILLLLALALMVVGMQVTRSWRPTRALLALGGIPVGVAVALGLVGQAFAGGETAVRLVSVDVRAGAPVALVRTVDVRRFRPDVPQSKTAWVTVLDPPLEEGGVKSQVHITESVDVMDVPVPLAAVADPSDASEMAIRRAGGDAVRGYACRAQGQVKAEQRVSQALGQMLLDRCTGQGGVVAPFQTDWIPDVTPLLEGGARGTSAWVHVFGGRP